jgi:hypothetical protein
MRRLLFLLVFSTFAFGQAGPRAPAGPVPRYPNGKVNLNSVPGREPGLWRSAGGNESFLENENAKPQTGTQAPRKPKPSEVPFQPWARALLDYRRGNALEPHTRCKPSGGPRQFLTPYGVEFVDLPELEQIYILDVGGPHSFRTVYMDGRSHPQDLEPSYYGHSIGRWEGDTLVVDTIGFNEAFWFTRQGINTDKLHLIERFTRNDYNSMRYEVTIDDPGAYTALWSSGFILHWIPGQEMWEYVCQDNNLGPELMLGSQTAIDRSSEFVP